MYLFSNGPEGYKKKEEEKKKEFLKVKKKYLKREEKFESVKTHRWRSDIHASKKFSKNSLWDSNNKQTFGPPGMMVKFAVRESWRDA